MQAQLSQVLKNSLKLSVKHRLIQSVDVLACSLIDLNELIDTYAIKNPFLKVRNNNEHMYLDGNTNQQQTIETIEQPITLSQHLKTQLSILRLDENTKNYTDIIINSLDDDGYLRISLSDLANAVDLSENKLKQAFLTVQNLEPIGIAARSLSECFYLQLKYKNMLSKPMELLIDNIDKIASLSQNELAAICDVSVDILQEMLLVLRGLDPSPGKVFTNDMPAYIVPDIILDRNNNYEIKVKINNEAALQVFFDQSYFDEVYAQISNQEDKKFLNECFKDAQTLIDDIQKRESSISRISNYIVAKQQDYLLGLNKSPEHIKQRDIANYLDIHESTVSRAINNKYVSYQGKTLALQRLLGTTAANSDSIAEQIQELINKEQANDVLSDEDIVGILKDRGISIARRTVAKYRTELRIPSSLKRRQQWARYK